MERTATRFVVQFSCFFSAHIVGVVASRSLMLVFGILNVLLDDALVQLVNGLLCLVELPFKIADFRVPQA